jgi:hypothetical protein
MYGQQENPAEKLGRHHHESGVEYKANGVEQRQGERSMSASGVAGAAALGGFGGRLVSDFLLGDRGFDYRGRDGNIVVVTGQGNGNNRDALTDTVNSGFTRLENNDNSILSSVDGVRTQLDTQRWRFVCQHKSG